jgi:ACS family hexuronate transporter-like MFS transporter
MSAIEETRIDDEPGFSRGRMGQVRWTICAMLFFATSINYMDRQVIALLKPTLSHTIGLTEINYGYIVDAFQLAYALGLLVAGRVVDKVGTRLGYIMVMGVWSLSAMGHALASTPFEFGIARFFLGIGESGNFPAAIKTVAEWFPQGNLQFRRQCRSDSCAAARAVGNAEVWMACCISHHRHFQHDLDCMVVQELP